MAGPILKYTMIIIPISPEEQLYVYTQIRHSKMFVKLLE